MCEGSLNSSFNLGKNGLKPLPYYILSTEKFSDLGLLAFRKARIGMPGVFSSSLFGGQILSWAFWRECGTILVKSFHQPEMPVSQGTKAGIFWAPCSWPVHVICYQQGTKFRRQNVALWPKVKP